jgi:hypothetical protein
VINKKKKIKFSINNYSSLFFNEIGFLLRKGIAIPKTNVQPNKKKIDIYLRRGIVIPRNGVQSNKIIDIIYK